MPADAPKVQASVRRHLEDGDLNTLFLTTLGWDAPEVSEPLRNGPATATQIAEKRGVGVWLVEGADGPALEQLDREIAKRSHERLVVARDAQGLVWQWPERRRSGYIRRSRVAQRSRGEISDIVQRLATLRFDPGEDRNLTVLDVRDRVRRSFNTERVTEAFFKEFKACHELMGGKLDGDEGTTSTGMIQGIPSKDDRRWYASILLNRLMFLYFLQKKGFLDNDLDYLRNRLRRLQTGSSDPGRFYGDFLIPLFHRAIGAREVANLDSMTRSLVGDVPYLNGGVFAVHPLEQRYDIHVPNEAFDRIFSVFDEYRWHLDDREDASGEEINPDILGHIFERYVNQKDTGAFYTPNDTTGWMAAGSVGVALLDGLVDVGVSIGGLVKADPRRYLPEDLLFGERLVEVHDAFPKPGTAAAAEWSTPGSPDVALPDETTWEVRDRLKYAFALESELIAGTVQSPADAFDRNLNLIALISDAIDTLTPAKLDEFWARLTKVSILDPTCGSGAFLLAGLDVLEEVAELVVARASALASIQKTLIHREIEAVHPSARRLHIRQRLVLGCLFGTDIAAEAVDIARLRLYLALVAVMFDRDDLRPLPDLEFNLVAGNLLVGVNTPAEMEQAVGGALWARQELEGLRAQLSILADAISAFRKSQEEAGSQPLGALKANARKQADALSGALDHALHKAVATGMPFDAWLISHQPLHILAEFPEVMLKGGFDVVIGNPPYVKRSKVVREYRFEGYETSDSPDIFAPCTERAVALVRPGGMLAFVLPYAAAWSDDFRSVRQVLAGQGAVSMACFGRNPDAIFRGVGIRNAITFVRRGDRASIHVTSMQRWTSRFRPALFGTLRWHASSAAIIDGAGWARLGSDFAVELWSRLRTTASPPTLGHRGGTPLYSKKTALYWVPVSPRHLRTIGATGGEVETGELMTLALRDPETRDATFAFLASKLGLVLWNAISDDFHVVQRHFSQIPVVPHAVGLRSELADIGSRAAEMLQASEEAHLWTPYAGYWVESLDTRVASSVLDQAVGAVLEHVGLADRWDELEAWYWRTMKSTGERPGTARGHKPPARPVKGGVRRHGTVAKTA